VKLNNAPSLFVGFADAEQTQGRGDRYIAQILDATPQIGAVLTAVALNERECQQSELGEEHAD